MVSGILATKQNAESGKPFSLNAHVRERLESWDNRVSGFCKKNQRKLLFIDFK